MSVLDWQDKAACHPQNGDHAPLFFDDKAIREAKAVCSACAVRTECLEFALADSTIVGVWGGLSETERRTLRRRRGRARAAAKRATGMEEQSA